MRRGGADRGAAAHHYRVCSDLHGEHRHDAGVRLLAQLHGDKAVVLLVPEGGRGRRDCRPVVLLDDARDHVLELFVELGEVLDACFDDLLGPLVDLLALVLNLVGTKHIAEVLFGDALHILGVELVLVF